MLFRGVCFVYFWDAGTWGEKNSERAFRRCGPHRDLAPDQVVLSGVGRIGAAIRGILHERDNVIFRGLYSRANLGVPGAGRAAHRHQMDGAGHSGIGQYAGRIAEISHVRRPPKKLIRLADKVPTAQSRVRTIPPCTSVALGRSQPGRCNDSSALWRRTRRKWGSGVCPF